MRPERQSEAAQDLTKPPSNAFGSPARVTLGLQPAADGSFAGMGSVLQLKNKSAPGTDRGQTLPYPRVWPLGEKDREVWPWGVGREAEQVKSAGLEGRHRFRGQGQGQRTLMQRRGPQGTRGRAGPHPRYPQFPGAFPGRPAMRARSPATLWRVSKDHLSTPVG